MNENFNLEPFDAKSDASKESVGKPYYVVSEDVAAIIGLKLPILMTETEKDAFFQELFKNRKLPGYTHE